MRIGMLLQPKKIKKIKMSLQNQTIAFQGAFGAYSDVACRSVFSDMKTLPCTSFEDAFTAVQSQEADLAMIPVDNTIAGRVADVHHLIPRSGLNIIGEHFQEIRHALLGIKGAELGDLKTVHSHIHAIPQCRDFIRSHGLKAYVHADTAGAAKDVAEKGDRSQGAIASILAAEIYNLDILADDIQDAAHNTTRFLVLSAKPEPDSYDPDADYITSFLFRSRNIPAALYKCLGGFATNKVNMLKLESYVGERFEVAQFYVDVAGHPDEQPLKLALEELDFFAREVTVLGTYKAHPFRSMTK